METKTKVIDRFLGNYRFLSNFYQVPVYHNGIVFKSVEHAYQALKAVTDVDFQYVKNSPTPDIARTRGRKIKKRDDWEAVRVPIMQELVRAKFFSTTLTHRLLETGDAELIEGNSWQDKFWGVHHGEGQNMLGKILMDLRKDIRNAKTVKREL